MPTASYEIENLFTLTKEIFTGSPQIVCSASYLWYPSEIGNKEFFVLVLGAFLSFIMCL